MHWSSRFLSDMIMSAWVAVLLIQTLLATKKDTDMTVEKQRWCQSGKGISGHFESIQVVLFEIVYLTKICMAESIDSLIEAPVLALVGAHARPLLNNT